MVTVHVVINLHKCVSRPSYLDVLGKGFIELLVIVLVFRELSKQFKAFLHNVLANNLKNFALLQHLSRDVQGKILRVDHTTDEV